MEEKEIRDTVKKVQEKIEENQEVFDKLIAGEVPTDAELDELHKLINSDRDHAITGGYRCYRKKNHRRSGNGTKKRFKHRLRQYF